MLALDLSAIMAGSGIRGAFEEKFKALLRDIEDEVSEIITIHSLARLMIAIGWECHLLHRRAAYSLQSRKGGGQH